jgi:7-keto-8-aminopelargonate synthetase-like enzyme
MPSPQNSSTSKSSPCAPADFRQDTDRAKASIRFRAQEHRKIHGAQSCQDVTFFIRENATQMLNIKEALQEKEGIDVKQIRLINSGKQL